MPCNGDAAMSRPTITLKVGVPLALSGDAKCLFAVCDAHVPVNVPELVTGEPDTVSSAGKDNATLVTVPSVGDAHDGKPPASVNTWPLDPTGSHAIAVELDA